MPFIRTRAAARLGAAAAAVLTLGGLTAVPAGAVGTVGSAGSAGAHFLVALSSPQVTLLPQASGAQAQRFHSVGVSVMAEDAPLSGVTVAVDASGLAGVAGLSLPRGCAFTDAAGLHARCTLGSVDAVGQIEVGLRSLSGAAVGAKGSVRFEVTANGAVEDPTDPPAITKVVVGDGADLAVLPLPATLSVDPGRTLPVNPQVTNVGDQDASGVTLILDSLLGSDWTVGGGFANCRYGADPGLDDPTAVVCHFDTVVKPGETYELAAPAPVSAAPHALDGMLMYGWDVTGGPIDTSFTGGTAGHGAALALVPVPAPARQVAPFVAPDINYDNNVAISGLHQVSPDDVAAVAHDVRGTVGRATRAVFGVRNDGTVPTRQVPGAPVGATAMLAVMLPQGVTVVSAPKGCELQSPDGTPSVAGLARMRSEVAADGFPDGVLYACPVTEALRPGAEADFAFVLKPTRTLHAAQGLVLAAGQPDDNTPLDNLATFQVTATAATATPSPTAHPSTSASAPASTVAGPTTQGSSGGTLADTGGGDDALPLAGAGLAAVVLGGAVLALTRRRGAGAAGGRHN